VKIARLTTDALGGRFLAAGHTPDPRTLSTFRLQHGEALRSLFRQSLLLCQRAGMVSLGHVALDGSEFAANARKHNAMSDGRRVEAEALLSAAVDPMREQAAAADAAEDAPFGPENLGSPLGWELARRQSRLAKRREAKATLEAEAKAAALAAKERYDARERARTEAGQPKMGSTYTTLGPDSPCNRESPPRRAGILECHRAGVDGQEAAQSGEGGLRAWTVNHRTTEEGCNLASVLPKTAPHGWRCEPCHLPNPR
jgi:hypothetical protein